MSELTLPEGWVSSSIGNVNTYKSKNIKPFDSSDTVFELYSVPIFFSGYPEILEGKEIGSSKSVVEKDDVLICKINPRINRVWIVKDCTEHRNIASSEWIVFRQSLLNPKFMKYYYQSLGFRDKLCADVSGVGGSLTRAKPREVANYLLPIASIAEQNKISHLLDEYLTTVSQIQARLDAIPKLIEKFRQSVLNDAVSGKLTEEWREKNETKSINLNEITEFWTEKYSLDGKKYKLPLFEPLVVKSDLPNNWHYTQLGKIFDVYVGSTPSRKENQYWNGDIPWVSSSEVAFCRIKNTKEKVTEIGIKNTSTNVHPVGTVMLAMIGQGKTRGQAAILDIEACHNQNTAAIRIPKPFVISDYLYFYLMKMYQETRMVGSGNNQKALNKSRVQSLGLRLPPIDEQEQIVKQINQLFAHADQIEKSVATAKARVDNLTQSILHQAFTGNLTAEWREQNPELISGDNSAEALLAKIKAEKKKASKA